jgi:hypothetical protein
MRKMQAPMDLEIVVCSYFPLDNGAHLALIDTRFLTDDCGDVGPVEHALRAESVKLIVSPLVWKQYTEIPDCDKRQALEYLYFWIRENGKAPSVQASNTAGDDSD